MQNSTSKVPSHVATQAGHVDEQKELRNFLFYAQQVTSMTHDAGRLDQWSVSGVRQGKKIVVLEKNQNHEPMIVAIMFCNPSSRTIHGIMYREVDNLDVKSLMQCEGNQCNSSAIDEVSFASIQECLNSMESFVHSQSSTNMKTSQGYCCVS